MKSLIPFFLKYLLAPLLAMIMVFVMGALKSIRQQLSVKRIIVFSLLAGLFLGLPSLFGFLKNEYVWEGLMLTVISYLILGFAYLWALRTFISKKNDDFFMEILVIVLSGGVGMWIYYLVFDWTSDGLDYAPWAMTAVCWFMIPYFVFRSFKFFQNIQPPIYDLWRINHSGFNRNYWDTLDTFKATTVKVKLKRNVGDYGYAILSVRLAEGIALGDWFDWLVEDQNRRFPQAQIEINMDDAESGWIFYTSKWFKYPLFIRMLDPRCTASENNIKKDQIIYIKRVKSINHIQHEED
ncbi:TssN family type VI secretion system protein [Prevotella intermedia]|uniref:TssN family type VI secretion system protein n=1 Tax=Prevotella intermedia TaxID=28131 RepID=A0A2G9ID33_PREIN|nr:TssN family type VI secretion system protein [Prevotella intermedia]PIN27510.1 hypothetical protein CUC04_09040 [Prevotella intermedia]